ncbi:MAG: T9SS type A sorting domain-containing protein, partial [Dysgonamonadaceae bacterium]|nr:T9SS type A sorting domain-containing protein [Dysgonamonadaceae bacterium]
EAVKDLFFQGQSDEFTVDDFYGSPGDFGLQKLYYKELEQLFFYGTIVWMGCGEIKYPAIWNIPQEYPHTAQRDIVIPKNGFEWTGIREGWQPPSEEAEDAWHSVMSLVMVREFIAANPEEKVKVYFYQPSVGVGDPRDWKWIFILRNQSPQNQSSPTVIDNVSLAECKLQQNIPNPFSQSTVIRYTLPQTGKQAQMVITGTSGSVIRKIPLQSGTDSITIEGGALSAGIYYYSLYVDGSLIDTKQMILTK